MRFAFALSLAVLLGACAPPRAPSQSPKAVELGAERSRSLAPINRPHALWCYEVGDAPARIKPRCKSTPESCEAALAEARRGGLADGFGDPFSECRPMREDDFKRPRRLSGKTPLYSQAARDAGVRGRVIARCTLTVAGKLEDCKIVVSLPLVDQAVLDALATWRLEPALFVGRPVEITYTVPFQFAP